MTDLQRPPTSGVCWLCHTMTGVGERGPWLSHLLLAHNNVWRAAMMQGAAQSLRDEVEQKLAIAREYEADGDEFLQLARPSFPTDLQKVGIVEAVGRIRLGEGRIRHGGGTLARVVSVDPGIAWIHVKTGGPWRIDKTRIAWDFTTEDVAALLTFTESLGVSVAESWRGSGWLSMTLARPVLPWRGYHLSDCATNNGPALEAGSCDCEGRDPVSLDEFKSMLGSRLYELPELWQLRGDRS